MRHLLALSLVVTTGCGDDLGVPGSDDALGDLDGAMQDDGVVRRLVPQVCATRSWGEVAVEAKDLDFTVVPTWNGATVLHVPRAGGPLGGFQLDGRGLIMGDPEGMTLHDGAWTDVSASVTEGRLVVGLTDGAMTQVAAVRDDLGEVRKLALTTGGVIGDTMILEARGTRFTATGGVAGMVMTAFDDGWTPTASTVFARSVPLSMTSAPYGTDAMIAWSTEDACHLTRVASGTSAVQSFACPEGRLATSYADRGGTLVWQGGDSVMRTTIKADGHNELAATAPLAESAWAPRVAFDGERYWVSYIDLQGQIVVGYLDEVGALVSTAVAHKPLGTSHELAFFDGAMWAFAYDAETGFGASRLCLVREGT